MEHTKRDGETISMFLLRVNAWNNGEPVPPDLVAPPAPAHRRKHQLSWWNKCGHWCGADGCYARVDKPVTLTLSCPVSVEISAKC